MRHFCTLFDHNYLYKGLALYDSLMKNSGDFTLWILAMSDTAYDILNKLDLKNVELIKLSDFEDKELKEVKKTRNSVEYCWTLTPSLPLFILKKEKSIKMVTYIDADCYFYSNSEPIYDEMDKASVLIIEHRYSEDKKYQEAESGIYNVQFMAFRNDRFGLEVLNWWRKKCNEWCYSYVEDGKYGDQKYLDDWPERFKQVHVLKNIGGGVAPWNIGNYDIISKSKKIIVGKTPLIFYHFHGLKILNKGKFILASNFKIKKNEKDIIYQPYLESLEEQAKKIKAIDPSFSFGFSKREPLHKRILQNYIFSSTYKLKKMIIGGK